MLAALAGLAELGRAFSSAHTREARLPEFACGSIAISGKIGRHIF